MAFPAPTARTAGQRQRLGGRKRSLFRRQIHPHRSATGRIPVYVGLGQGREKHRRIRHVLRHFHALSGRSGQEKRRPRDHHRIPAAQSRSRPPPLCRRRAGRLHRTARGRRAGNFARHRRRHRFRAARRLAELGLSRVQTARTQTRPARRRRRGRRGRLHPRHAGLSGLHPQSCQRLRFRYLKAA